ncbi:unnamed protein product [Boreogadus saida]
MLYINFTMEYFFIKLPDGSTMSFPNRLGDIKYKFFEVHSDARIVGIKIKSPSHRPPVSLIKSLYIFSSLTL